MQNSPSSNFHFSPSFEPWLSQSNISKSSLEFVDFLSSSFAFLSGDTFAIISLGKGSINVGDFASINATFGSFGNDCCRLQPDLAAIDIANAGITLGFLYRFSSTFELKTYLPLPFLICKNSKVKG